MLAIFGFRKNRSQSASNQGLEVDTDVYRDAGYAVAVPGTGFVVLFRCHISDCAPGSLGSLRSL